MTSSSGRGLLCDDEADAKAGKRVTAKKTKSRKDERRASLEGGREATMMYVCVCVYV